MEEKDAGPEPLLVKEKEPECPLISIEQFAQINLRVGKVLSAEPVPKSKKLLRLEVDLGSSSPKRQVLAGIAQHVAAETLIGKQIVVVANLTPATLMGLESQGMLLAVENTEGKVGVIEISSEFEPGSKVR